MKGNPRFATGTLRRGLDALEVAESAFERRRFALVVSLAQQAAELALKADLRWAGIDPPRQHDVGDLLRARGARFPAWFRREVPFLRESSELLARLREPATYGSPSEDRSPGELFADPAVAQDALDRGRRVCALSSRLVARNGGPSAALVKA
ncbi:MAG: HEPN domain-containing protein [Thermoplasmata archaeon]|nr:HEPN domain-containing protein [Thermoplasmata archaeon]